MRISFNFLKPSFYKLGLTAFILCLPLLKEEYNRGQYLTWHQPIIIIADYFKNPQPLSFIAVIAVFILIVYFFSALVLSSVLKIEEKLGIILDRFLF